MAVPQQRQFLLGLAENLPGLSFLLLLRVHGDLRLAGWVGAILAGCVCFAYAKRVIRPDSILVGINLFMAAITPLIELLYQSGYPDQAQFLVRNIDTLVLCSVLMSGLVLTLWTKTGFLSHPSKNPKQTQLYSGIMLAVCTVCALWSSAFEGDRLISLALPLSLLFGVRHYLRARAADKRPHAGAAIAAPATGHSTDSTT